MKKNKLAPAIAAVLTALIIAAIASAQSVGLGVNKDSTLQGAGSSGSKLGVNTTTLAGSGLDKTSTTLLVGAGSGLTVSADAVSIDSSYTQRRVTGTCGAGSAVTAVDATGGVTCGTAGSTYTAGAGLTLSSTTFNVGAGTGIQVNADDVQVNIAGASCSAGSFVSAISATGTGTCTAEPGDISAVTVTDPACSAGSFVANLTGGATSGAAPVGGTCVAEVGDISAVTAGTGLSGGASSGPATLTVNISGASCSAGQVVTAIGATGTGTCTAIGTAGGVTGTGTSGKLTAWNGTTSTTDYAGASSCSAGSFYTGFSATGASTCTASGLTGLTTNRTQKALSGTTVGDAWADEDGTTWGRASKFTITESTGAFHGYSTGTVDALLTTAGLTNTAQELKTGFITDTISADVNDYAPTGFSTAGVIRLSTGGSPGPGGWTITGIAGGAEGRVIEIQNTSASTIIRLEDQSVSTASSAANRIITGMSAGARITGGGSARLIYDGTNSRWKLSSYTSAYWNGNNIISVTANAISTTDLTVTSNVILTGVIAPTAISGTNNDYAPTSGGTASTWRQDLSADATLTGINTTSTTGRVFSIQNISTTYFLTLTNEDGGSTATDRFTLPNAASWIIPPGGAVLLRRNSASRWTPWTSENASPTLKNVTISGTLGVTGAMTAASTKNGGAITLSGGTGTATVTSGTHCTCSSTTANPVYCSVSSTTLTVTGTGTDVASYLCM